MKFEAKFYMKYSIIFCMICRLLAGFHAHKGDGQYTKLALKNLKKKINNLKVLTKQYYYLKS